MMEPITEQCHQWQPPRERVQRCARCGARCERAPNGLIELFEYTGSRDSSVTPREDIDWTR